MIQAVICALHRPHRRFEGKLAYRYGYYRLLRPGLCRSIVSRSLRTSSPFRVERDCPKRFGEPAGNLYGNTSGHGTAVPRDIFEAWNCLGDRSDGSFQSGRDWLNHSAALPSLTRHPIEALRMATWVLLPRHLPRNSPLRRTAEMGCPASSARVASNPHRVCRYGLT